MAMTWVFTEYIVVDAMFAWLEALGYAVPHNSKIVNLRNALLPSALYIGDIERVVDEVI